MVEMIAKLPFCAPRGVVFRVVFRGFIAKTTKWDGKTTVFL